MQKQKNTAVELAKEKLNSRVISDMNSLCKELILKECIDALGAIKENTLKFDSEINRLNICGYGTNSYRVLVLVVVDISFNYYDKLNSEEKSFESSHAPFEVVYSGKYTDNLDEIKFIKFCPHRDRDKDSIRYTNSIVPSFPMQDLEQVAESFLKKYQPELLKKPASVDFDCLLKDMHLTKVDINSKEKYFGRIYLSGKNKGLIEVNIASDRNKNVGGYNNTLMHECIHWEYHRHAFLFSEKYLKGKNNITCNINNGDIEYISRHEESQANSLSPKILMPMKVVKDFYKNQEQKYLREIPEITVRDLYVRIIKDIAEVFKVSLFSANIRLKGLGFGEGVRAFEYTDHHFVESHSFKPGYLTEYETFTIPISEAVELSNSNNDKYKDYIFVDNHLVLNNEKFVDFSNKIPVLTEYAKEHMDECCLHFSNIFYSIFDLDSKANTGEYASKTETKQNNTFTVKEMNNILECADESSEIVKKLPNNFVDAYKEVQKYKKIKNVDISNETGISEKTISNILNGRSDGNIECVVSMCLALHVPYDVTEKLISLSKHKLRPDNKKEAYYRTVLQNWWPYDVREIRKIFHEHNILNIL